MDYKSVLNARNLKATPQRLQLISLLEQRGHMTIEAIYQTLKTDAPMLSLSTVYNNLTALSRSQIVREVAFAGSAQVYELVKADHAHLICKHCGEVIDLECRYSAVKRALKLPQGVRLEQGDLIFNGVCAACAEIHDETCTETSGENHDKTCTEIHAETSAKTYAKTCKQANGAV
ncbi:hypothetical protein FACS1894103_7500 [Campylobacterota bacterium]|nr:hypothetical protein FACS1894103_7500 [Campylobacterota bacterium]